MDNPYDIPDTWAEDVIYRCVNLKHSGNSEVLDLCEDLCYRYGSGMSYKGDDIHIYHNGGGQLFLSLKVRKWIFWTEWVDVMECSQWFKWTTPALRKSVVEHIKMLFKFEKESFTIENEIRKCNEEIERMDKENEMLMKQALVLNQWG